MASLSLVFAALADTTRLQIILMLRDREMSAGEIAAAFTISQPSVSHHLSVLRAARLVRSQRHGQRVVYALNSGQIETALSAFLESLGASNRQDPGHMMAR